MRFPDTHAPPPFRRRSVRVRIHTVPPRASVAPENIAMANGRNTPANGGKSFGGKFPLAVPEPRNPGGGRDAIADTTRSPAPPVPVPQFPNFPVAGKSTRALGTRASPTPPQHPIAAG